MPEADQATELPITVGQEPVAKTFNIYRNSTEDTFTISAAELPVTKRNVLRKAATVFDLLRSVRTAFNACTWNTHAICYILSRHHGCTVVDSDLGGTFVPLWPILSGRFKW